MVTGTVHERKRQKASTGLTEEVSSRAGINGFLAPPGEVERLAAGVCTLLGDENRRKAMGGAAARGLELFDINLMVRRQEELYRCLSCRTN